MNRAYIDSIPYRILTTLTCAGWVSGRGLKLLPYTEDRIVRAIRKLQDEEAISCKKTPGGKQYTLLENGKNTLQTHEPDKYRFLSRHKTKYDAFRIERESLLGESLVAFSQAGYASADKPPLRTMLLNGESDIYYTGREIKRHIRCMELGGKGDGALKASRLCGALFTAHSVIRVYSTFHTAPRLRGTAEERVLVPLLGIAGNRCGARSLPCAILFGDKQHRAARRILENSFQAANPSKARKKVGQDTGADNMKVNSLGAKTLYVPVLRKAVPLLALLKYPDWEPELEAACVRAVGGTPLVQSQYFSGRGPNGDIFVLIGMDLAKLYYLITLLRLEKPQQGIEIICMEWQHDFLVGLLRTSVPDLRFTTTLISDSLLPALAKRLERR